MKLLGVPPALSRAPRSSLLQGAVMGLDLGTSTVCAVSSEGEPSRAAVSELGRLPWEIDLG